MVSTNRPFADPVDEKVKALDAVAARYQGTVNEKQSDLKSAAVHAPATTVAHDDAPRHDWSNQNKRRSFHRG